MQALLNLYLDICLLRKGPQDLPMSQVLLKLSLTIYALSSWLILLVVTGPFDALLQALVDSALLAAMTYGVLISARYSARFVQTLSALAGTGALLGVVALPIFIWIDQEMARNGNPGLPRLFFLGLVVWNIAVIAHVLHHALSVNRWVGLIYALGYFLVSMLIMQLLFPASA